MRLKLFVLLFLGVGVWLIAHPASGQVAPAYQRQKTWPISVGVGLSNYAVDEGHGRMYGGTFWVDWLPGFLPSSLHGLGLEVEARDISLNRSSSQPNAREDTAQGGPIYEWLHYDNFHPYAKFLYGQGSIDFIGSSTYAHDTRSFWALGGGFEYRLYRQLWLRADYEHQRWQPLLGSNFIFKPQGFTVGVAYDFAHPRRQER